MLPHSKLETGKNGKHFFSSHYKKIPRYLAKRYRGILLIRHPEPMGSGTELQPTHICRLFISPFRGLGGLYF